jgi:holliday junction DNA helicase RuvA
MIASIEGHVTHLAESSLVIQINGIGYRVHVPAFLVGSLRPGERVSLFTELIVREDSLTLYGFREQEEVELFQELIRVNGVGPRLALETLSTHSPDVLKRAVLNKQEEVFAQVSGVGKKTAQKIILSLEDRISFGEEHQLSPEITGINDEVQEALVSLGYSILEAQAALQTIPEDAPLDLESRLTIALRFFS